MVLRRTWKHELIKKIKVENKIIILDLATGSGDLFKLIKEKVIVFVLYDSNMKMIMQAKKKIKKAKHHLH